MVQYRVMLFPACRNADKKLIPLFRTFFVSLATLIELTRILEK